MGLVNLLTSYSTYGNYGNYGNYNYPNTTTDASQWLPILGGFVIVLAIFIIAVAVFMIITYWKLFKKAGRNGWEIFIPYYNGWVLNDIAGIHWIWFIVLVVASAGVSYSGDVSSGYAASCTALILLIDLMISINIAKKFGKTTGFGVLCALIPIVGYPILAFGSASYDHDLEVAPHGIFDRDFNKKAKKNVKPAETKKSPASKGFCPECGEKISGNSSFCPKCGAKLK